MTKKTASNNRKKRSKRRRLWEVNPHCYWCGQLTILDWEPPADARAGDPRRKHPGNLATIDHLRSRYDPTRQEPNTTGDTRLVLACRDCNGVRNKVEQEDISLDILRIVSGYYKRFTE